MARFRKACLTSVLLLFVTANAPVVFAADDASLTEFKAAIRAKYDLAGKAFNDKDARALVTQFYAEDATFVPPGPAVSVGREKIMEGYQKNMDGKGRIVSYKTHVNGNSGFDWANFYVTPDDKNKKPYVFKMLYLWEKRNAKWECIGATMTPGEFPIEGGAAGTL